jgi:hypothetical protein
MRHSGALLLSRESRSDESAIKLPREILRRRCRRSNVEIVRRVDDAFLAGLERGDFAGLSSETWRVKLMKPRPPRPAASSFSPQLRFEVTAVP